MATENEPLTELKCRDCEHCKMVDWCNTSRYCDVTMTPTTVDSPACISVKQREPGRRPGCLTNYKP